MDAGDWSVCGLHSDPATVAGLHIGPGLALDTLGPLWMDADGLRMGIM